MVIAQGAGFIDVDRVSVDGVSAHVPVELVSTYVAVEIVAVVITVRVVAAVVAIRMVATDVATMPRRVSVERVVVVHHRAAGPVASPRVPSPSARGQRTKCDAGTERERTGERNISCRVIGRHIGVAVNDGGVVLRNVDDLRVRWLNHNRLRTLLPDGHLRR